MEVIFISQNIRQSLFKWRFLKEFLYEYTEKTDIYAINYA